MVDKGVKELCPTCGQPMTFVKSEKQPKKLVETKIDEDMNGEAFDISQIWNCLNCSKTWELEVFKNIDLMKNIWRKNEMTE